jgi:hypothetical protein
MGLALSVSMSSAIILARPRHGHVQKLRSPIITRIPATGDAPFSTVPPRGGLNPYRVASCAPRLPREGQLQPGDVLVSNFNNSANQQGTGTTIDRLTHGGRQSAQVAFCARLYQGTLEPKKGSV